MSTIQIADLKKLLNKRIFGKALLGREPYVFRTPLRDDKQVVVGYRPEIEGVSYQYVILSCPAPRKLIVSGRGIGKSDIIIGNAVPHHALIQPFFDQAANYLTKPLPTKIILIGNLRETARKLQEKMRRDLLSHPLLASLVAEHTQTELHTRHGSHVYVRTAGNDGSSVRGLHSEILTNERGQSVKGKIHIYYDEAAFSRARNLIEEVIEPMMILNPNSSITVTTTPYGEEGEVWKAWSDQKSIDCMQHYEMRRQFVERLTLEGERYYRMETFRVYPKFDLEVCARCMSKRGWKRFAVPTAENPFMVPEALYDRRMSLIRNGLELVWNQEHMGLFQKAAGLFFPPAVWLKMLDDEAVFLDEDKDLRAFPGKRTGKFYLGIDSSSGIVTKGADFTALWLWEEVMVGRDAHYFARMVRRWRRPPEAWDGKAYDETRLLQFVIDFVRFLKKKTTVKRLTVGFGFGQGIYTSLQNDDDLRMDYYTDSEPELAAGFVWFRALGEMGRIHLPADCAPGGRHGYVSEEAGRLGITDGTTAGLRFKVYKMAGWGSGKTVDCLFAGMYGLKPTMRLLGMVAGTTVQTRPQVESPRSVGGDGVRELAVTGVRELSKN